MEIPYGQTVTYTEIAEKINRPDAVRAVGSYYLRTNRMTPYGRLERCPKANRMRKEHVTEMVLAKQSNIDYIYHLIIPDNFRQSANQGRIKNYR